MKKIIQSMLVIEFIACFSCITLLWGTGCFFASYWLFDLFNNIENNLAGLLFLLWIVAGGVGLAGVITLLIHLLQTHNGDANPRQLNAIVYGSIIIGIIANIILNFIFSDIWQDVIVQFTLSGLWVIVVFNAPIVCTLHFLWLNCRHDRNENIHCWFKNSSPTPPQT
ncbi:MAG TPA: hypothetical protein DIW64_11740 [Cellvibrio sp.]|nr:hypothetical protein [Cellvibrio sp.]